ncbi:MAG: exodeoxyribonuclease VII large subunit, partial [Pyrinomonadaceae bacterium]
MPQSLIESLLTPAEELPLSVSELTEILRETLESTFSSILVAGEVVDFNSYPSSGHWYFKIKDDRAVLSVVCFRGVNSRLRIKPENGMQVLIRGSVSIYSPRGQYQLIADKIEPTGAGQLYLAFEKLKEKLMKEGLFDASLKRSLPLFPRRIGVVTSTSGAAIHDILNVINRRTRTVNVIISAARVQGEGARLEIARAIQLLNNYNQVCLQTGRDDQLIDVIIVGRGGGSAEDLMEFNTEEVARSIRASTIPIISAIGHETDFTIADYAADLRAPTPSAAAEIVAAREDDI